METFGGPQLQHRAVPGFVPEVLPAEATGVARFSPPAVTGLGFLEALEEETLLALADPDDADGDGISGRVQLVDSTDFIAEIVSLGAILAGDQGSPPRPINGRYIGRFGRKARAINLLEQTVTAYVQDMGLTTDLVPLDVFNVQVGPQTADGVPDPEVPSSVVSSVVFYLRTLRPPPRRAADDPDVRAGEALFAQIGCAACHIPTLQTGFSPIAALNRVEIHPYTDLLLHDMGPELDDGYTEGTATTAEWRTTPLWGIGLAVRAQGGQGYFLHDGRARSFEEAIEYHGGEGAQSREAFRRLTPQEHDRLLRFLRSL
ncbi:MAG TPA: di-heme oxidoredictase family protein, partial [Rubricoccaceae bacterium]|nr:di-heme oxidoredictase family protein [Rubricoccaceae bacterium]